MVLVLGIDFRPRGVDFGWSTFLGVDILARDHLGDLGVVFMVFQVLYRYMAWSSHISALVMVLEGLVAKEWS